MEPIILYTQPDCPPCEITKQFFKANNIQYIEKNIKTDAKAKKDLMVKYQSFSTPTVIIGEEIFRGFSLDAIAAKLNIQ